jgi:hypothetical protein
MYSIKPRQIVEIEGIYEGYDKKGEQEFEKQKGVVIQKQIELFHPSGSILTKKF